jgi:serine/threonine protein kinase
VLIIALLTLLLETQSIFGVSDRLHYMPSSLPAWDIAVGCILAELLGGRPIFKGRDYVDQLNQILHFQGTPDDATLRRVGSPRVSIIISVSAGPKTSRQAQEYIRSLPFKQGIPFHQLYPNANQLGLDLLAKLLAFDPAKRITCQEALEHPYLSVWHDP